MNRLTLLALLLNVAFASGGAEEPWDSLPALKSQAYEMGLIIEAVKTAATIEAEEGTELARLKYRVLDAQDEMALLAFGRMAKRLEDHPNPEWIERLLAHFQDHHAASANEGWIPVICRICLVDPKTTIDYAAGLAADRRRSLRRNLSSPLNDFRPDDCRGLAGQMSPAE